MKTQQNWLGQMKLLLLSSFAALAPLALQARVGAYDPQASGVTIVVQPKPEQKAPAKPQPVKVEIKDEETSDVASLAAAPVDPKPRVLWLYSAGMRFGIGAVETKKLLTYAANGATNQTLLRVNGQIGEFGGPLGKFVERDAKLTEDAAKNVYAGSKSVWASGNLHYTQILELVPSKQPHLAPRDSQGARLLDTVRVRYLIENKDTKTFKVGLRTQIDTLIGGNDGVPFTVPGLSGLVTHFADFPRVAPIPDFIQALERPNLRDPGTVAHLSLKLGGAIEAPGRVSLTHWPGVGYPNWDVPLMPLAGDSAVVLYWFDKLLKPGEIREMGYAYGLGSVASSDPGGKLGLTLGGSFEPGESFTVTAYVQGVEKGQTLALELPEGLERIDGTEVQKVPPPVRGVITSIVTWKVKVLETGNFPLKVASSNGLSQAKLICIARPHATTAKMPTIVRSDTSGGGNVVQTIKPSYSAGQTLTATEATRRVRVVMAAVSSMQVAPMTGILFSFRINAAQD
jgi:hypothetical protein